MNTTNDNLANSITQQDTKGKGHCCLCLQLQDETLKDQHRNQAELALSDLLYLTGLPLLMHYCVTGEHSIFGEFMCKFICFSFHFKLYRSMLFLTCSSAFCYMVMVHTMKFFHIQRKWWTAMACTTIWLMALEAVSPVNFLISSKGTQDFRSSCLSLPSSANLGTIRWLLTSLAFFLSLLTVTLCYVLIICTLATGPTHGLAANKRL